MDEADRHSWLEVLDEVCRRFNWTVHSYCQMTNHYHLLAETPDANLTTGMRQLNGLYTQRFNRRHRVVGHLFQGRYKAIIVQKEGYLLELSRYVVLNPVRAGMVRNLLDWPWSSFPAVIGNEEAVPSWLDTEWLLSLFAGDRGEAIETYCRFVQEGVKVSSPLNQIRHQMFLGDEIFTRRFHQTATEDKLSEVSKAHRRAVAKPLAAYRKTYSDRTQAMAQAYLSGAYTMQEIGRFFGVHYMTVSRAVSKFEAPRKTGEGTDNGM